MTLIVNNTEFSYPVMCHGMGWCHNHKLANRVVQALFL